MYVKEKMCMHTVVVVDAGASPTTARHSGLLESSFIPYLRQAWTAQKRDFGGDRFLIFFAPKCSLDLGDLLFQVSALFFD